MTTALAHEPAISSQTIERVVLDGDLSGLNPRQRLEYYQARCEAVGLDPISQPFQYLRLNNKLVLYATKTATDQLRSIRAISVTGLEAREVGDVYCVIAHVRDRDGRTDSATGAVPMHNLKGEALANALMKAETKAKRRATLSICGLGMLDESELDTIPAAAAIREPIVHAPVTLDAPASPQPTQRHAKPDAPKTFAETLHGALGYWQKLRPSKRIDETARRRDSLINRLKEWAVESDLMPDDIDDGNIDDALGRVYIANTQAVRKELIHIIESLAARENAVASCVD